MCVVTKKATDENWDQVGIFLGEISNGPKNTTYSIDMTYEGVSCVFLGPCTLCFAWAHRFVQVPPKKKKSAQPHLDVQKLDKWGKKKKNFYSTGDESFRVTPNFTFHLLVSHLFSFNIDILWYKSH